MLRVTLFTLFWMLVGPVLAAADPRYFSLKSVTYDRYVFAHFMVMRIDHQILIGRWAIPIPILCPTGPKIFWQLRDTESMALL